MKCKSLLLIFAFCLLYFDQSTSGEKATFCAVGDVLLDRYVRTKIEENDVYYPFEKVSKFINSYNLAFCNLECPISDRGDALPKRFIFRADPAYMEGLKTSGFNIFSLANNHTIDYGRDALMDTKEIIEANGFYTVGVGRNQQEAEKAQIIEINGMKFAFLAYVTMALEGIVYTADLPGPAQANIEEIELQIAEAHQAADFVIVSYHWGDEFSSYPSDLQIEYAHRSIEIGADLVIGHHPHVLQSIEKYRGKFIMYSLGNFVFDQERLDGRQSMVFGCTFDDGKINSAYVIPIMITLCQPELATHDIFCQIADKLQIISEEFGVNFRKKGKFLFLE